MSWLSRNLAKLGSRDWFLETYTSEVNCDSPKCSLLHSGGNLVYKTIHMEAAVAATANLFIVSGPVRVIGIYGVVTALGAGGVSTDDTVDDLKLELDDGAQVDLTLANSDLTGNGTVGTVIIKDAEDSVKMTVLQADAMKYHEGATNRLFQEGIIVPNPGTTTYIRVSYDGDANTDITIRWFIRYAPKTMTAAVVAV